MLNSKKLLALAFCLSIIISMNASKASEQILADISVDAFSDLYQLTIDSNEDTQTINSVYVDDLLNGKRLTRDEVTLSNFIKHGIKLPQNSIISFAKIESHHFDGEQGGMLIINTLFNVLTGRHKSYEVQLAKDQLGWRLFKSGKMITQIKVVVNTNTLIGMVGVKELIFK